MSFFGYGKAKVPDVVQVQSIVVTYSQFDSNILVFYVFLGFSKNT
jgi:hypothetical protein